MDKRKRRRSHRSFNRYENLEQRKMLATISVQSINDIPQLVIDGTNGNDEVVVSELNANEVNITFTSTPDEGPAVEGQETVARADFERIRFLGRNGNDSFTNDTDIDSAAFGHSGDDTLRGGDGHNWIQGGSGDDSIYGGSRNDFLRGRDGNDFIEGGQRHDRIFGGNGDDVVSASAGNDFIRGEAGNDQIFGGNGNDRINPGAGVDVVDFGNSNGNDKAVYDQALIDYSLEAQSDEAIEISGPNGSQDTLQAADSIQFSDIDQAVEDYFTDDDNGLSEIENAILNHVNSFRVANGRSELTLQQDISDFAENWAMDNLVPLGPNPTVSELESAHVMSADDLQSLLNGERTSYSENLAFLTDQDISDEVAAELIHDSFVNSSVHRANILNPNSTEVGIGVIRNSHGWYVVQSFFET